MFWTWFIILLLVGVTIEVFLQYSYKTKPKNRDLKSGGVYPSNSKISKSAKKHRDAPFGASYMFNDDPDFISEHLRDPEDD